MSNTKSKKLNDLIKKISEDTTVNSTQKAVKAAFVGILDLLRNEDTDKVLIKGFGRFEKVTVPERTYRNPRTGESITKEPKQVIKFKASKKVFLK